MSTGTKITAWEEIVAVPVGVLVLVIGLPIVAGIEVWNEMRAIAPIANTGEEHV